MSLVELFCHVDDFCQTFEPAWEHLQLSSGTKTRRRAGQLCLSEIMTLIIHFHQSSYRNFKAYYTEYVQVYLRSAFPNLVSYERFVHLQSRALGPLLAYLHSLYGPCSGTSFIDSTALGVCHNRRIPAHRVFAGLAARGKTSMGWFYGFKLHLVVNDQGELLACHLTPGNVDDRQPVPLLAQRLWGKLFGDRGYVSQPLMEQLWHTLNVHLITKLRKNMKNRLMLLSDKLLLRKRAIIETIIDQLKNISQIEHTRHRSPVNFFVNVLAGLIAYCHQPKKPALKFAQTGRALALIHY
jgi:transposase